MPIIIVGGTGDITVHEKKSDGTLKELHTVSGGPWGGNSVNNAFLELIESIVGKIVMNKFKQTQLADALDLEKGFEMKKRTITPDFSGKIVIKIPLSLHELFQQSGQTIHEAVEQYGCKLKWVRDKMHIDASLIHKCFEKPLQEILKLVHTILSEQLMTSLGTIMLVGGLSESKYVQKAFRDKFQDKNIIVPQDCGLAVVKGAVLFGHQPEVISSRVARYTYGVEIAAIFDPNKHEHSKKVPTDTGPVCKDIFWKIVAINEDVLRDHKILRKGRAVNDHQRRIRRKLFKTVDENPVYTTDPGCTYVGEFCFPLDETLLCDENTITEKYCFGGTEIFCITVHDKTGDVHNCRLTLE